MYLCLQTIVVEGFAQWPTERVWFSFTLKVSPCSVSCTLCVLHFSFLMLIHLWQTGCVQRLKLWICFNPGTLITWHNNGWSEYEDTALQMCVTETECSPLEFHKGKCQKGIFTRWADEEWGRDESAGDPSVGSDFQDRKEKHLQILKCFNCYTENVN